MKKVSFGFVVLVCVMPFLSFGQSSENDLSSLVGKWTLDLSPHDSTDTNFAMMEITSIDKKSMTGIFYREGVEMQEGRVNTQLEVIYGALISEDGSGQYNTSFYLKNGILYGSTHAVDRGFLAVWTGTKNNN